MEADLQKYYLEIFPVEEVFQALQITETRELSFTTQQDAYVRFLSFDSPAAFREKIAQIGPKKIDVGAIHDMRPLKMSAAKPVGRELVFDIDLTDYPRSCCEGKMICEQCYAKIKCAVKILDYSLRKEFGFKHVGFVFSGRRGVHCWVFDYKCLSQAVRTDIFRFYQQVIDKNQFVPEYHEIMKEFSADEKNLIREWFVRIDKQVTTSMNHLIKSPFSVHADTLNISVPLDPENMLEFKDLPNLRDIISDPSKIRPFVELMKTWTR